MIRYRLPRQQHPATTDPMLGHTDPMAPGGGVPPTGGWGDEASAAVINLLAGAWLFFSHWWLGYTRGDPTWNDVIFGIIVFVLALARLAHLPGSRFASVMNMAIGVWLVIAGLTIASSGAAVANNIILGVIVFVVGAIAAMAHAPADARHGDHRFGPPHTVQ
jgi:hypothetical protein